MGAVVVADEGRTAGALPVRQHLRPSRDHLCAWAMERSTVPVLVLQDRPDGSGFQPWRWYRIGPVAPLSVVVELAIGGEA